MGNTLITISRQHGSGGTKVAQILAEKLGIWYYNREILYIAADKIGYDSLDEKSMDEINYKKASKYMEGLSIMTGSRNHIPVYNQMFKEQSKIIKNMHDIRFDIIKQTLIVSDNNCACFGSFQFVHSFRNDTKSIDIQTGVRLVKNA